MIQWKETVGYAAPPPPPVEKRMTLTVEGEDGKRVRFATEEDVRKAAKSPGLMLTAPMPLCDCGANAACAGANGPTPHKEGCAAFPRVGGTFTLGGEKDPRP